MANGNGVKKVLNWDSTVNIGNLIFLGIFLLTLFGTFKTIETKVDGFQEKFSAIEKNIHSLNTDKAAYSELESLKSRVRSNEEMRTFVARLDERLKNIECLLQEMRDRQE